MTQTNRRILVVDDNQTIHDDFRKILCPGQAGASDLDAAEAALFGAPSRKVEMPRFEVDSALQGRDGLALVEKALAENKRYSVAFVDMRMPPGWDGIETTLRIWEKDPELQIVICTAYSEYSWEEMLARLGHSDRLLILKKPFDNIEVLQLANALTEKWRLLQETRGQLTLLEEKVQERTAQLQAANDQLQGEIAERKQAEKALRESQEMVLRQERLAVVGQLAAGVAHEFNNILTVIQGYTNLLLGEEGLAPSVSEPLLHIRTSADRAALLTRQMLAFSRKQVMQKQTLQLNEIVGHMTSMLQSVLRENITISFEPAQTLPAIRGDAGMIEQVIMNLAVNARDAMPKGGQLRLSTSFQEIAESDLARFSASELPDAARFSEPSSGRFACLAVIDTGCGMDKETMQHLFEPFFTTKDVGKGTGLGLATVYGVVKQHEGWIDVTSKPGGGTTFKIYLPVCEQGRISNGSMPDHSKVTPLRQPTANILVVEDEDALRAMVKAILERQGYRVLEAASGLEAMQCWQKNRGKVDLLLTDMMMPEGMSGRDLAARLLAEDPNLAVIYSSGYNEEMVGSDIWRDGHTFLAKPYRPVELLKMVSAALERTRAVTAAARSS